MDSGEIDWEKAAIIFAPEKESWQKKLKKPFDTYPLAKDLILLLAAVGAVGLFVIMPGTAILAGSIVRAQQKYAFKKRLENLQNKKLIEIITDKNGDQVVKITREGMKVALKYKFEEMAIKAPNRWDKKWRLVIFDVPENKRKNRDSFRSKLKEMGFYQLNESVLVHAFPCFDEVEYLRQIYLVGGEVTYILAEKIENPDLLLNYFNLSKC